MTATPGDHSNHWLGCQRIDLDDCNSTNDEAARLARAGASHGTIVIAETQRAGRGRGGRSWSSPRGGGLYLSAVLRPPLPLVDVPPITLAIGVALCDAIRSFDVLAQLKWPNDVLVHGKKLAGVLVESQSQGTRVEAVIVGIGVNLSGELAPEVADTAITLRDAMPVAAHDDPAAIFRERFIVRLLAQLERWVDRYVAIGLPEVIPAWQARMAPSQARAMIDGAPLEGAVAGLDVDGALLLRDDAGTLHRVRSGDVEVMRHGHPGHVHAHAAQ